MNNTSKINSSKPLFRSAQIQGAGQLQVQQHDAAAWPKEVNFFDDDEPPANVSHSQGWQNPQLTVLSLYYPLGSCVLRLSQDRLFAVLDKLQTLFQKFSLETTYQDAPLSATCKTLDHAVEFEVSLFADNKNKNQLIVEMERRSGDGMAFYDYANQIQKHLTAKDEEEEEDFMPQHLPSPINAWNQTLLQLADTLGAAGETTDISGALETAWSLLHTTDRHDAQRLGLESLVHMTDPNKCGLAVATATTACLLFPESTQQQEVAQTVFGHAVVRGAVDCNDFSNLALVICAQSFQVAAYAKMNISQAFPLCNGGGGALVDSLLDTVGGMQRHVHSAYYAVQSLVALCECVPPLKHWIRQSIVQEAQLYGNSCHFALATASHQLLQCLQTVV